MERGGGQLVYPLYTTGDKFSTSWTVPSDGVVVPVGGSKGREGGKRSWHEEDDTAEGDNDFYLPKRVFIPGGGGGWEGCVMVGQTIEALL